MKSAVLCCIQNQSVHCSTDPIPAVLAACVSVQQAQNDKSLRMQPHNSRFTLSAPLSDAHSWIWVRAQVSIEIIEYDDLCFGKFLGQGAEGSVYAAWYMDTPVAVKQTDSVSEVEMNLHAGLPLHLMMMIFALHNTRWAMVCCHSQWLLHNKVSACV